MKWLSIVSLLSAAAIASVSATPVDSETHDLHMRAQAEGIDVDAHQKDINWRGVKANGVSFAYIHATQGTSYRNPSFGSQYNDTYNAGLIRGPYHVALPDKSSGATQAQFFYSNGGRWRDDGTTLPGALDIRYNPNDNNTPCYGMGPRASVNWIRDFSDTYYKLAGRNPVIFTSTAWWKRCTGNSPGFGSNHRLWIARHAPSIGELPAGWNTTAFWQYSTSSANPGNSDVFMGTPGELERFARSGGLY